MSEIKKVVDSFKQDSKKSYSKLKSEKLRKMQTVIRKNCNGASEKFHQHNAMFQFVDKCNDEVAKSFNDAPKCYKICKVILHSFGANLKRSNFRDLMFFSYHLM